jgi:CBS domain containing-hemolysin-like protein
MAARRRRGLDAKARTEQSSMSPQYASSSDTVREIKYQILHTMASLGLGWVGEPTVSALLEPLLLPFGMPESALHFTSFVTGFLVFSSLQLCLAED